MKDDKTLLPQKSQFGDKFWLIRDDLAVCENGFLFLFDLEKVAKYLLRFNCIFMLLCSHYF